MELRTFLSCFKIKPLNLIEPKRQQFKARHGFACHYMVSTENKVIAKIVDKFLLKEIYKI